MSSRGRAGRLLSQPKFAGRRSAAARQELEKAEAEKKRAEQEASAAKAPNRAGRGEWGGPGGRGDASRGRGRGRGGYVGENDRGQSGAIASGPFSAGQGSKKQSSGWTGGTRGGHGGSSETGSQSGPFGGGIRPSSSGLSGGRKVKQEPGTDAARIADMDRDVSMSMVPSERKTADGGYISSDEEEDDPRKNIEDFAFIDLTANDKPDTEFFSPIRIPRVAHKGRTIGINADGTTNKDGDIAVDINDAATNVTSSKKQGKQRIKEEKPAVETQPFMSVYEDSGSEDGAEQKDLVTEEPRPGTPEERERLPNNDGPQGVLSSPERNKKAKQRVRVAQPIFRHQRADYQTPEELVEWDIHQRDLEILQSELGGSAADPNHQTQDATTSDTASTDKRANKVYLFQFPPVLPDLAAVQVKADPESTTQVMAIDGPSNSVEDPIAVSDVAPPNQPKLPTGRVGKLRIHASGRATLDWGGTSFSLGMGADAAFLQDIVVANLPETKVDEKDGLVGQPSTGAGGIAVSMGQVKGKFIVTPDWDEILR